MMLSHQYRCSYSVGAFSSFLDWVDAGQDGLGYIRDIQTGNPTPSSPYDIAAVSITEGFSPLFGVDATLLNNITGKFELRKTRNLSPEYFLLPIGGSAFQRIRDRSRI